MNASPPSSRPTALFGLLRRTECWRPTFIGYLLVLLIVVGLAVSLLLSVYPFLAPNHPLTEGAVVVEGWGGKRLMSAALEEYRKHPVPPLLVAGGPIEDDSPLTEQFSSFGELGVWQLKRLGASAAEIQAVPAPLVPKDRTFASADAIRDWFAQHGGIPGQFTVVSSGPHSRRTWMLYQEAFGPGTKVGILSVPEPSYDPARWWERSAGFRGVTDETIAYLYARCLFWRPAE